MEPKKMPLYSVHLRGSGLESFAEAEFVRQAFCWKAFFFGPLWLARHRLWVGLLLWAAAYLVLIAALPAVLSASSIFLIALCLQIFLGLEANRLREAKLARQGYRLAEIIAAPASELAETRFYRQVEAREEAQDSPPGAQDDAQP
jgi:Protein of unknown function (DUF2628)